ncbi:MAG: TspO/MBR family protein [Solirubrobacterales bacterium]
MKAAYLALKKPFFAPPASVFGPVWTVLYLLMAYSAFRVFRVGWEKPQVKTALLLFGIQLVLNLIWTPLFFTFALRGLALVDLIVLLAVLVLTTIRFYALDHIAAYLLVPYVAWVSFAGVLNASVWWLNR